MIYTCGLVRSSFQTNCVLPTTRLLGSYSQPAPFNAGGDHYITVNFGDAVTLSMIRIWNYNKSRTHAYRGVRVVRLSLDDRVIFEGEILLGSGVLDGVENCSEVKLVTNSKFPIHHFFPLFSLMS